MQTELFQTNQESSYKDITVSNEVGNNTLTSVIKPSIPNIALETNELRYLLNNLVPEESEVDKEVNQAIEILGDRLQGFTSFQIKTILSEVQYLVDCWLEDYERTIFNGITLIEYLQRNPV